MTTGNLDIPTHVAVVVVCWNNETIIGECLKSVADQDYPAEYLHTYVVDNGSADGSVQFVHDQFPWATVVETGWNSGFAIANNIGIRRARSDRSVDYVVLLNSDATLSSNWISTLVDFAKSRTRGACFQSLTLDGRNPERIDSSHIFVDSGLQSRQAGYGNRGSAAEHLTRRVFGVNAAAALYSVAFLEAQPFEDVLDQRMWMYLEDVDLSARALVMGWENWTVSGTSAMHLGSASTAKRTSGFALGQTARNQPILWLTNLPLGMILRAIPDLVKHDRGAVRHLRVTGQTDAIKPFLLGRLKGFLQIPYALSRRSRLRPYCRLAPEALQVFMSTGNLHP